MNLDHFIWANRPNQTILRCDFVKIAIGVNAQLHLFHARHCQLKARNFIEQRVVRGQSRSSVVVRHS